jgi:hypothetical protein
VDAAEAQGPGTYEFAVRVSDGVATTERPSPSMSTRPTRRTVLAGVPARRVHSRRRGVRVHRERNRCRPAGAIARVLARRRSRGSLDRCFIRRLHLDPRGIAGSG